MSYDAEDWFDEKILPELKKLIKSSKNDETSKFDEFISIIRSSLLDQYRLPFYLKGALLRSILDPTDEKLDIQDMIEDCFDVLSCDEAILNSISYLKGNNKIDVLFHQYPTEESQK